MRRSPMRAWTPSNFISSCSFWPNSSSVESTGLLADDEDAKAGEGGIG